MCHQKITIEIFPDTPAVVEFCNPFFLTKPQCVNLKGNVIEKLRDFFKEGFELLELKERLVLGMTPYSQGDYARKKTRQSHLDAYLDHYKEVPCSSQSEVLKVHAFVLASLDNSDWVCLRKYNTDFWKWALEELSEVVEPPIGWVNTLEERLRKLDKKNMAKGEELPDNLNNLKECEEQSRLDRY
ncbi:hypothetical protein DIS24_g11986 [Lasiodiplodia hormozganensis]|uniref:Uncharacterized protein n=1 Tax=Lasiodiplodia hormozganensis TaxID=869390 RepID=A0AA39W4W7_9PEZI|nr:hypothetical protein DIS24_g11986 [Lasiodiplodia hormozganensis]